MASQEERVREQLAVVALGGNAISPPGSASPIPAQYERTMETAHHLAHLTERPLVVTHGNGPQVGNLLLRSDLAAGVLPGRRWTPAWPTPRAAWASCSSSASTTPSIRRGAAGHRQRGHPHGGRRRRPGVRRSSKPIGDFYDEADARRRMDTQGWVMREDAGRGWRRVVPSPEPREIVELPQIKALLDTGAVVVAAGGGGIPVVRGPTAPWPGSRRWSTRTWPRPCSRPSWGPRCCWSSPGSSTWPSTSAAPPSATCTSWAPAELAGHAAGGQFAPGSMLPKVQAVLWFLERGGRRAIITTPALSEKALAGEIGTQVVP